MVFVNYLANALPLNGKNTGQLSDQYPNLFTPAGFTFAVWGVIYTALFIFCLYQARSLFSRNPDLETETVVAKTDTLFILTCVLNICWIFAWQYEFVGLSVVIMLAFLATLVRLNLQAGVGRFAISQREKYLAHLAFGIYLGWISIATIANITAFLVGIHWDGFGFTAAFWAVAMIAAGIIITLFVVLRTNSIFYGLVVIWALYGIAAKRFALIDTDPFYSVPYTAIGGMVLIALAVLMRTKAWQRYGHPHPPLP